MVLLRRLAARVVCAAVLLVLPATASAQRPIPNLELMRGLTDKAIAELLAGMPAGVKARDIVLVPIGSDERYEFLTNGFGRVLTNRGYQTHVAFPVDTTGVRLSRGGSALELEYQALDFDLSYPKVYRSYLIGGRKVRRMARVNLLARLIDPQDQSIMWIGESSKDHEDQFAHKHLSHVEAGLYTFNKPAQPSARWGKVVEPVVVSGIIVGLIYLFFSNQSGN